MGSSTVVVIGRDVSDATVAAFSEYDLSIECVDDAESVTGILEDKHGAVLCSVNPDTSVPLEAFSFIQTANLNVPVYLGIDQSQQQFAADALEAGATDYVYWSELQSNPDLLARKISLQIEAHPDSSIISDFNRQLVQSIRLFHDLQSIFANSDLTTNERLDRAVETAAERLDYPIAFVSRIEDDQQEIISAAGDHELLQPGKTDMLTRAYCRETIKLDEGLVIKDATNEGWNDDPAFERYNLHCYVGAKITVDDTVYGTFCFADTTPRPELIVQIQQTIVETLAERISIELAQPIGRFKTVFQGAPDPIIIHTPDGDIVEVNQRATEQLGYSYDQLCSMNVRDIEVNLSEDELLNIWDESVDGRQILRGEHKRADESTYPVEVWVTSVDIGGEVQYIAIARDISKQETYAKRLEEQRNNLELLNQVMRHDIRNDLQLIDAYASELTDHVDPEGEKFRSIIADAASDSIALTNTARDLAAMMLESDPELQTISLPTIIEQECDAVSSTYPNAEITIEHPIPGQDVIGSEMIDTVFRNILRNAVQHNDKSTPKVTVTGTVTMGKYDDDVVEIRILDNGPGVPDSRKEEIFGHGAHGLDSSGTGIGLYFADTIIEDSHGHVWVEDSGQEGAVFVVQLPVAD